MTKTFSETLQKHLKIFRIVIITALLSASVTSCGLFDKDLKQDKHIAEFRQKMSKINDSLSNHNERIKAFEKIVEHIESDKDLITPRKKNNLLIEGNIHISNEYFVMNEYDKAITYANIIIQLDTTQSKGYYTRGCIYQITKEDSLAFLDYNKAILLNTNYTDAYYNRGIIYESREEYDLALSDYNKTIKLNPPYIADVYNNRGNTFFAKGAFITAIDDYSTVLKLDTANVKAYSNRAGAHIMQKELGKALADCNKAIVLDSAHIIAYSKRASVYKLKKEYETAITDYKKIIELDPNNKYNLHDTAKYNIQKLAPLIRKK